MTVDGVDVDDRALLRAHVAGDPRAFTVLVHRHRDRLWAVALRTAGDADEAADALQDALLSAYRNAAGFRGEAAVTTWLHRIVVNACLDRIRRRVARAAEPLGDRDLALPGDSHAAADARMDVESLLRRLPQAQRLAIVLVELEGLSVMEAAQVLGVAEGTIKSRCARARLAMAAMLREGAAQVSGNRTPGSRVGAGEAVGSTVGGPMRRRRARESESGRRRGTTPTEDEGW